MWIQRSIYTLPKISGENITFLKKINFNIVRTFYNENGAINFLIQNINKKRFDLSNTVYKEEKQPDPDKSVFDFIFAPQLAPEKHHFFTYHFKEWWQYKMKEYRKYSHKMFYKDNLSLGPNIATAKFVLRLGGRIKFYHQTDWLEKVKGKVTDLPTDYHPDYILEGIDLRGYPIQFENLSNLCNLFQLRWLYLRGCETIDDWAIDKLATEYPSLECLDVSNCKNVTEKGLVALYKMPNLKKLIVTDFYNSAAFKLTCFMLEDINTYLKCEIETPEKRLLPDQ